MASRCGLQCWRGPDPEPSEIGCELAFALLWHATPARAQREGQRVSGQAPRQRRAPATPLLFFLPVNTHSQDPSSCPDRFATLSGLPDTLFPPPRVVPTRPKRAHATRARPCPGEPPGDFAINHSQRRVPILCLRIFAHLGLPF